MELGVANSNSLRERSSKTLTLMASCDNDFSSLPLGWRGLAYIVPPNECGPSDQTDLNRTVVLED